MRTTDYVPKITDRLIRVERATPSRDGSGAEILTWDLLCTRYAAVSDTNTSISGEKTTSKKEVAYKVVIFTTRYVQGLTEKDRVVYDNVAYDITQIEELGRRHMMTLYTERRI